MRYDKIKVKQKNNVIDLSSHKTESQLTSTVFSDDNWTIISDKSFYSNLKISNIISSTLFNSYSDDMDIVRKFLLTESQIFSFKSIQELYYSLRHFLTHYYINYSKSILSINYESIVSYLNYMKSNNCKKQRRKYASLLRLLSFIKDNNYSCHSDILNKNFPAVKFTDNSEQKVSFYSEDEFIRISKTLSLIIHDYFKGTLPQHLFVKSSFWFFAFLTGFNMSGLLSLRKDSFSILTEDNDTVRYLVIGEKNRSYDGYQKSIIEFNKKSEQYLLFKKILNELILISDEISLSIVKPIDEGFLFLSYSFFWHDDQLPDKRNYFRYDGSDFKTNVKAKPYFELNNLSDVYLSTRKIRNQYSVSLFNVTNSEKTVQEVLNHKNISTTLNHYIKYELSNEMIIKFKIFQELMFKFSKSEDIDWSLYQKKLNIKGKPLDILINELNLGVYDTPMGNCFNKIDNNGNICDSYLNCFNCSNYSMIADKDLWKLYSFKENILELKKESPFFSDIYLPITEVIDSFIKEVDKDMIYELKKKINKFGKHPFWKNKSLFEKITSSFEENIICKS